jgi:hypothetical protein
MIGNSLLTNEQEMFLNILSNVGCMSKEQAIHIMKDYLGMRTNSVNAAITNLSLRRLIKVSHDGDFITPGGFSVKESLKRNTVEDIGIMCHVYDKVIKSGNSEDVKNNICFVFRPHSEFEFSFISEGEIYQMIHIPKDQIFKMSVIQKKLEDQKKELKGAENNGINVIPTTLFIFSVEADEENILEAVESLELEIPHCLIFMKSKEFNHSIEFSMYESK